jgi:hypothetical protein
MLVKLWIVCDRVRSSIVRAVSKLWGVNYQLYIQGISLLRHLQELDITSRVRRRVGLIELVVNLEVGRARVNVEDGLSALVHGVEEGTEGRVAEVGALKVGEKDDAHGTELVERIGGLGDRGRGVRERDDGVERELAGVSAYVCGGLLVDKTRERDGQQLIALVNVCTWCGESEDGACNARGRHKVKVTCEHRLDMTLRVSHCHYD